jgi:uncharacterized membrane protein YphA (DoxX/SURF4 family)
MKTIGQVGKIVVVAGRFLAGGFYLTAGIGNLAALDMAAGYTAAKGVPNAAFWVTFASLLLVVGGASIMTGIRPAVGVAAIAFFLVPVTLIMHNFWAMEGMAATLETRAFMGNVGLLGSTLMFLAIPQPWAFSLDRWLISRAAALRARPARVGGQRAAAVDIYSVK